MSWRGIVLVGSALALIALWLWSLGSSDGAPLQDVADPAADGKRHARLERGAGTRDPSAVAAETRVPVVAAEPTSEDEREADAPVGRVELKVFLDVYDADATRTPPITVQEALMVLQSTGVGLMARVRRGHAEIARDLVRIERWPEWWDDHGFQVATLRFLDEFVAGDVIELRWGVETIASQRVADVDRFAFRIEVGDLFGRGASLAGRVVGGKCPDDFELQLVTSRGGRKVHVDGDGVIQHANLLAPGHYFLVGCQPKLTDVRSDLLPRTPSLVPRHVRLEAGRTLDLGTVPCRPSMYLEGWIEQPAEPDPYLDYTLLELWGESVDRSVVLLHRFEVPVGGPFRIEGLSPAVYLVGARHGIRSGPMTKEGLLRVDLSMSDLHSLRVKSTGRE